MAPLRHRDQAIGGKRLGLAFRSHWLDRLDLHTIHRESDRRLTDEDLAEGSRLLEARRGVHGVSGDEPLPGGRIARHDFTGVDA